MNNTPQSNSNANCRNSSFELLRIICMLFIVSHHLQLLHADITVFDYEIGRLFKPFVIVAVNVYILISGWFGINFKLKRLVSLITQTWFYSVLGFVVAVVLGYHKIILHRDILVFIPIIAHKYWFVTSYVILYIMSPFINPVVNTVCKRTFFRFLLVSFIIFYFWPTFSYLLNSEQPEPGSGYGIVNFFIFYCLGRFLRLHFNDKHSFLFYFNIYILISLLKFFIVYFLSKFVFGFEFNAWQHTYDNVFVYFGSVSLFLAFTHISFQSTLVNIFARTCLSVYLLHSSPCLPFGDIISISSYSNWNYMGTLIVIPIILYLLVSVIEYIRIWLFSPVNDWLFGICSCMYGKCMSQQCKLFSSFQKSNIS